MTPGNTGRESGSEAGENSTYKQVITIDSMVLETLWETLWNTSSEWGAGVLIHQLPAPFSWDLPQSCWILDTYRLSYKWVDQFHGVLKKAFEKKNKVIKMLGVGRLQYTWELSNAAAGELIDWGTRGRAPRAPATNALKIHLDFRTQWNVISHEPNFSLLQEAKYHSNVIASKVLFHKTNFQKCALRGPL